MNSAAPSLFPAPAIPPAAVSEVQMACTAAALSRSQLSSALSRDGWSEQGVVEIARLISASLSIHEQLLAMLVPAGGKR